MPGYSKNPPPGINQEGTSDGTLSLTANAGTRNLNNPPQQPRSQSVELAEMDNIVNTQDDVLRRYVGLRDGLDEMEQEVSLLRSLNGGSRTNQPSSQRSRHITVDSSHRNLAGSVSDSDEELDR